MYWFFVEVVFCFAIAVGFALLWKTLQDTIDRLRNAEHQMQGLVKELQKLGYIDWNW